jgi:hypothetical protein
MKKISTFAKKNLSRIGLIVLLCSGAGQARAGFIALLRGDGQENEPAPATSPQRFAFVGNAEVKELSGDVRVLKGIERWEKLNLGTKLSPGDLIQTGKNGKAMLKMQSGSLVKISPNSILRLAPFEPGMDPAVLSGKPEGKGFSVRSLHGAALCQGSGNQWAPVDVNTLLPEGSLLRLSNNTTLDLFDSSSGGFVRLEGQAELKLDSALFTGHSVKSSTQPALASASVGPALAVAVGR